MRVVLNVFIVPQDAPGLIGADMQLIHLDSNTVQMSLRDGPVVNFDINQMIETLEMFMRLEKIV